ncbi:MAG: tetratricopeptide repeat protein [Gemmatimonadetes bacterium]|nr:tetratricopeptide repeat protein [Gemmatimonadota bacterium]
MAASEIEKLETRYAENPEGRYFAPLADAYRKAGRVDDALQLVQKGLEKHPDYLSAHIVLGRCFLDKKDDLAAQGAFGNVLGIDSENIIALKSLAEIAERTGDTESARRWLQKLLVVDSMNTDAEADLQRLGGPLPEETPAEAAPAEEAPAAEISFADVTAAAEAPTEPVPAVELEPVESPPAITEAPTEPIPAVIIEEPVTPEEVAPPPDLVPFDDSLQWGAGERLSGAVRVEDLEAAHHEEPLGAPAIEFLDTGPSLEAARAPAEEPAAAGSVWDAAPEIPSLDLEAPPAAGASGAAPAEIAGADLGPTGDLMIPLGVGPEEAPAAAAEPMVPREAPPSADLPLIMPEDVTPPEEMARPSTKQVQMVSPQPTAEEPPAGGKPEPMLTETMGDLYLKQGFKSEAADVYRRLLAQRPDDPTLRAKLAQVEGPPPSLSAASLGAEPVGAWLQRVARASLSAPMPPRAAPPPEEPTPMEAAFAAAEPEVAVVGEPAHPASDAFSLDQIFGAESATGGQTPAPEPAPPAPPAAPASASFDEFFGAKPEEESVRPKPAEAAPPAEDDLSAFNAWLHGLKR